MTPWAVINPARLAGSGLLRTQSDARLVDLVRAGNDRAFEAIVLRYHKPLLRHCRRLLPAGRAEDAVQQTLLRALEAMRADERELQLSPWLHRIAHNTAIDSLRRMDSHWEELDERMDGVEPTHAAVERRARFDSVVSGISSLPERQRRALVLRELEGRSYDEIAATLGVTGAGVRQLLNRARNTMRAAASALVPPALVGRIAGSQASARIAELADPPGTSALLAKATAAVAAGAVALLAVNGPPSGDGGRVSRSEADTRAPAAAQSRLDEGARSAPVAAPAGPAVEAREPDAAKPGARGDGGSRGRDGSGDGAPGAGPGPAGDGDGDDGDARAPARGTGDDDGEADDDAPATRPRGGGDDDDDAPASGQGRGGDDDDAPASGQGRGGDDDDDDAPASGQGRGGNDDGDGASAPGAPAGGDDGGGGEADDGAAVAVTPPPEDGGGEDDADDGTAATSAAPAPEPPVAALGGGDAEQPDDD
jgi:RNA polymerase sigma factor (sigma-70 family)